MLDWLSSIFARGRHGTSPDAASLPPGTTCGVQLSVTDLVLIRLAVEEKLAVLRGRLSVATQPRGYILRQRVVWYEEILAKIDGVVNDRYPEHE